MLIKNAIAHVFNIIHNMFNLRGTEVVIWIMDNISLIKEITLIII